MIKYSLTMFDKDEVNFKSLIRLERSSFVLLILHLMTEQSLEFNKESLSQMFIFLQKSYFKVDPATNEFFIQPFKLETKVSQKFL